jgi:hypothetical protein
VIGSNKPMFIVSMLGGMSGYNFVVEGIIKGGGQKTR